MLVLLDKRNFRGRVGLGWPDRKEEWKRKCQGRTIGEQIAWLIMVFPGEFLRASTGEGSYLQGRGREVIYRGAINRRWGE